MCFYVLVLLLAAAFAEQICIETIPGQGAPLHNLSTIVACSPDSGIIRDAYDSRNLTDLLVVLGNAANASVTVHVPENATMSDPFPAWCGAYVVDRQSGSEFDQQRFDL